MTYQHKKGQCVKDTRDILTKLVLEIKKSEYAMMKGSSEDEGESDTEGRNILHPADEMPASEQLEEYSHPRQVKFKSSEAKESFEKKKKKRNYLEFKDR
jgi:hypothetical protein